VNLICPADGLPVTGKELTVNPVSVVSVLHEKEKEFGASEKMRMNNALFC
jgi:hypothetical protein